MNDLRNLGFIDDSKNLKYIRMMKGDINQVAESLLREGK
jgi:hypothetical protein